MRKLILSAICCSISVLLGPAAFAQKGDLAFGLSSLITPSGASATGNYAPQTLGGGLYPSFTVDFMVKHHLGVEGGVSWRASRNLYEGYEPFRPIIYDINGMWVQKLLPKVSVQATAGIGALSARFYPGTYTCNFFSCTNYVSTNHFLGHFGAGVKLYVHGNFFIRPEVDYYLIRNNYEFSSGGATKAGASIGYTF